jgi:hypothetical protein
LFPGPGQYYNPQVKIGQNQNIRYNNLYIRDTEPNLTLKYKKIKDFYYNSKVGPGSYNPDNNIIYKSYSQNPKIFISQLERGPLFKISDTIGPGQYNLSKDFTKGNKCNLTNQFKIQKNLNISTGTQFPERNFQIFNTFNNNNFDNILSLNDSKDKDNKKMNYSSNYNKDKLEGKKIRGTSGKYFNKDRKNFSWKGIPDFSGITIKYNEEGYYSIKFYGKLGGVSKAELCQLEYNFISLINFNLYVSEELFKKYNDYISSADSDEDDYFDDEY